MFSDAKCEGGYCFSGHRARKTFLKVFVRPPVPLLNESLIGFVKWCCCQRKKLNMGDFPSGQRGQTVNLLASPSVVRIHHLPPNKTHPNGVCFCLGDIWEVRWEPPKVVQSKQPQNRDRFCGLWSLEYEHFVAKCSEYSTKWRTQSIHHLPPEKDDCFCNRLFQWNSPAASEILLRNVKYASRMKYLLRKCWEANFISYWAMRDIS